MNSSIGRTREKESPPFYHWVPLLNQARFTLVNVFHESVEFSRNYTLPFNMINVCTRSEGDDSSVAVNLRT